VASFRTCLPSNVVIGGYGIQKYLARRFTRRVSFSHVGRLALAHRTKLIFNRRYTRYERRATIGFSPSCETNSSPPTASLCLPEDVGSLYGICGAVQADVEDEPCPDHSHRESSKIDPRCGELFRYFGCDARSVISLDAY